jgi:hypothetical protein
VVVVDDCSDSPDSQSALHLLENELSEQFHPSSVVVYNAKKRADSGTRNACSTFAKGTFLVFLDSDNYATPAMVCYICCVCYFPGLPHLVIFKVETLVRAAWYSKADIVTCALNEFDGNNVWLPI